MTLAGAVLPVLSAAPVLVTGIEDTVVTGSLLVAVPLALAAGLVSFLSPCVLPLLPGYLGFVTGLSRTPDATRRRTMVLGTALFVAGFSLVFIALGVAAGALGQVLRDHRDTLRIALGALTIVLGLAFAGWLPLAQRDLRPRHRPAPGLWGAPMLGVLFGLGWTPCIGPTLGAVLTLGAQQASPGRAALLALAYCAGLGLPFLAAALGYGGALGRWGWARRHHSLISTAGGVTLMILGVLLVTGLWDTAMIWTRSWVSGFSTPI